MQLRFKLMDYDKVEVLTLIIEPGPIHPDKFCIIDELEQKIDATSIQMQLDNRTATYVVHFNHNNITRRATVINAEK